MNGFGKKAKKTIPNHYVNLLQLIEGDIVDPATILNANGESLKESIDLFNESIKDLKGKIKDLKIKRNGPIDKISGKKKRFLRSLKTLYINLRELRIEAIEVDNIIENLIDNKSNIQKHYDYNYFHNYSKNISGNKNDIKQFILDHYNSINQDIINNIEFYLNLDINNRNTQNISKKDKINYILICFYIHIYHNNLDKIYLNSKYKEKLYILNKPRPDILNGIIEFEDRKIINCSIKQVLDLYNQTKYNEIIKKLINIRCPMPYIRLDFNTENNFIITEICEELDTTKDAFMEVFKDIVNQLKCINKHYYLEYIKPKDIGKSKLNFQRYYIYNFDSICEKKENISCYNLYDGRERYSKITDKDQIRTILNILSEFYSMGPEDYRTHIKTYPFDKINKDLNNYNGDDIHDYLLNKLLTNSYQ